MFNSNVAQGSVYAVEIKQVGTSKVSLTQDNGQTIVIHSDDLQEVIKKLNELSRLPIHGNL